MNNVKLAFLTVGILLAIALTFSCSSDDGNNPGDTSNPDVNVDTSGKSVEQLFASGIESLEAEKWDEAVAYYNAAYAKDNNDTKAIIYSVLANLAKISTDPKVVSLIKNNFGFTEYPNRLNALFSKDWLEKTPDYIEWGYWDESRNHWVSWFDAEEAERYELNQGEGYYYYNYDYDSYTDSYVLVSKTPKYTYTYLPTIKTLDWVRGDAYNEALLGGNVFGSEAWALSLLANLLEKNSSGVNSLLDEVIDGVFGTSYNEAVNRLKKLETKKEDRINLDPYFIEKLDLEDVFDKDDEIGWAEVNAVLSATLLVKASLEWLQTYDLNTDLNWLKHTWKDEKTFATRLSGVSAQNLPFNNNFLKPRGGKNINNARASYKKAIQSLQESYESIINSDLYPKKVKDSYNTINGGFGKLIAAIEGGKFYIPKDPTKGEWPKEKTNDVVGTIDFGKFFAAGYFSLENIFETSGGKPVFYRGYEVVTPIEREYCYDDCWWDYDGDDIIEICERTCDTYTYNSYDYNYEPLSKSNYSTKLDRNSDLCLKLDISYIKQVVDGVDLKFSSDDGGGEAGAWLMKQVVGDEFEYVHILPGGELAKTLFGKYYP